MAENFEIVPRHDDKPTAKETKPNTLSILESVADGFGKVIAAFIGGVGQAIAGVALGTAKFVGHIIDAAKQLAGGIAEAILGKGAEANVITGAVNERLGPIDTAISESGARMTELSDKVYENDRLQKQYRKESQDALAESRQKLSEAEDNIEQLAAADAERRQKVAELTTQSERFTKKAEDDAQALEAYKKLQQQKVDELTGTAEDALSRASKIVDSQGRITGELKKARDDASTAVSNIADVKNAHDAYKKSNDQKVASLTSKAEQGLADAKTAQDAITKANRELAKNISDGVANHEKVLATAEQAKQAATALDNLVDIGGSLIPLIAGTTTPAWTQMKSVTAAGEKWGGGDVYVGPEGYVSDRPPRRFVKVSPGITYRVSLWARADRPGTKLYIELRAEHDGGHAVDKSTQNTDGKFQSGNYPVSALTIDTRWTKYEWFITLREDVTSVYLGSFFFNHSNGSATAKQYIAKLEITPAVTPPQALDELSKKISDNTQAVAEAGRIAGEAKQGISEANRDFGTKVNEAIAANKDVQAAKKNAATAVSDLSTFNNSLGDAVSKLDTLQNNAILRNEKVGSANASAIDVINDALTTQKLVNQNHEKWSGAVQATLDHQDIFNQNQDKWNRATNDYLKKQKDLLLTTTSVAGGNATAIDALNKSWAAQIVVNLNQEKWNKGVETAVAANTGAIRALARIDTGSSLVLYEDLTDEEVKEAEENKRPLRVYRPSWSTAATHYMPGDHSWIVNHPVITEAWGVAGETGARSAKVNYAKVEPGMVYRLTYWHRAGGGGTKYFIQMATPAGEDNNVFVPLTKQEKKVDGKTVITWKEGSPTSYVVYDMSMPSGRWEKVDLRFRILDNVSRVRFAKIYWNHSSGGATGTQHIANLEFSLDVPTQADVDEAQNKAIEALDREAILNKDFREEQLKLEQEQKRIDLAQNRALRALNRSEAGSNVIPVWSSDDAPVGTTRPAWTVNSNSSGVNSSVYQGFRWHRFDSTQGPGSDNKVAVDANLEYDFTVWLHGTNGSKLFIELRDQNGDLAVESGSISAYTSNYSKGTVTRTGSGYLVVGCTLLNGWTKLTSRIKLKEGVTHVYVGSVFGSHVSGPSGNAYIGEDMSLTPHVPSQEEIDSVQNRAIEANSKAIRALARVDTGSSLILYEDLTDEEVAKAIESGNIPRASKPSWATATNTYLGPTHGMVKGNAIVREAWGVNASTGTLFCNHNYAKVEPGMVYKLTYWHRAGNGGSKYYIQMRTPEGEENSCLIPLTPVEKTVNGKKVTEWKEGSPTSYVVVGEEMPPYKWVKVEKRFRILEDVSKITFHAIYWNHSSGSSKQSQYIANMEFSLDVPTQQDVDAAQDESIKALQIAQEADDKTKLTQESTNRLVQAQIWTHQDLIELLDIRTPKLYGSKARDYSGDVKTRDTPNPYLGNTTRGYYTETPYYEQWAYPSKDDAFVYISCRGQWVGWINVSINWSSGVVDEWSYPVTDKERIFKFTGGAAHISMRFISVTIYPRSLRRIGICYLSAGRRGKSPLSGDYSKDPKFWGTYTDLNGLFRVSTPENIRLKNTVTCNKHVYIRDEDNNLKRIAAGKPIYSTNIYPEDQPPNYGTAYEFLEVDDPAELAVADGGYNLDSRRAWGPINEINA